MMDASSLKECLGVLAKNVYYCGASASDNPPVLYVKDKKAREAVIRLFQQKAVMFPSYGSIKVLTTSSLSLEKTRSLEEILMRVPHHTILLDPTATIERASVLVCITKQVRQLLGPVLKGCYFNSEKRTIHFFVKDAKQTLGLTDIREKIEPILLANTQRLSQPFYYSISISLKKPQGNVIAIDKASIAKGKVGNVIKTIVNKLKWPLLLASATSSLGMMGAAKAASTPPANGLPAVANINGWIGAAADYMHQKQNNGFGGIGEAGIAFPLTHDFAIQFHGYDGAAGGRNVQSIDGILFWRDPAQGLLGPHVMYTKSGTFHHGLYGLHGEYYFNSWTLTGEAGGVSRSDENGTGYAEAIISWYPKPDWRLYLGGILIDNKGGGEVGTEYQLGLHALPGLSIFADAGAGSNDLSYGFLGLRYYFGDVCNPCKTLIRRHREDMDPPTLDLIIMHTQEHTHKTQVTS